MSSVSPAATQELKGVLPGVSILTPDSEGYEVGIKRWSTYGEKRAGLIVYPTNAEEVSSAVRFCASSGIELAVCGGGHSSGGMSSSDGGVVIDLSKMRKVTVDVEAKTVTAQGGCQWKDIDAATTPHGLACVGGTVDHTGIGGLTLGGGFGWLSGVYGLVVDNLLEVEIVLANGKIVKTSAEQDPDLFWAVRGAGASFGVATSFTYRAHEQKNPVYAGVMMFPLDALATILEVGNRVIIDTTGKVAITFAIVSPPPAHQPAILVLVFYNGPEAEALDYFGPLLALTPLMNTCAMVPYAVSNTTLNAMVPHGRRVLLKGSAFVPPLQISFLEPIIEDYKTYIKENPAALPSAIMVEFIPYTKIISVPQTATAYTNRGAYGDMVFGSTLLDPALDETARKWNRKMADKIKAALVKRKEEGLDELTTQGVGEYGNYDGLGDNGEVIYGVNYKRLHELKKVYDPGNVFRVGKLL